LVVVFTEGGIEAVGTHRELMQSSPTYARLHQVYVGSPHTVITDQSYESAPLPLAS
jgi:hypothetical protein